LISAKKVKRVLSEPCPNGARHAKNYFKAFFSHESVYVHLERRKGRSEKNEINRLRNQRKTSRKVQKKCECREKKTVMRGKKRGKATEDKKENK
jgi:hypothetical protein